MNQLSSGPVFRQLTRMPVLVAALGYLVDMYDLFLFNIVRIPSLRALHLSEENILKQGIMLLNVQMAGLLIGGIVWGILGDKKGRLSVLFISILIYSLANIANGFVTTLGAYALLRFIAGFGLAGELGAGITLITETLPSRLRGYGATLVTTLGVFGALLAFLVTYFFDWRIAFFIGGGLGLVLMLLRVKVMESGIFLKLKQENVRKGDIRMLFTNGKRFRKYLNSIVVGMPIWFATGILITFSPEFGRAMHLDGPVDAGKAVLLTFVGQVGGNIVIASLSQHWESRKKVILIFILCSFACVLSFLLIPFRTAMPIYVLSVFLGFAGGYWTLFITMVAELFGSNLRATVATTVPNFVRGTLILTTYFFILARAHAGMMRGALYVGVIIYVLAIISLFSLEETFKKDMDFVET